MGLLVAAMLAVLVAGGAVYLGWAALQAAHRAMGAVGELIAQYRLADDRRDAERVCAWAVSERETFEKIITRGVVGAAVRNAGQSPVYDVEIVFTDPPAAWTAIRRVRIVPPSEQPEVYAGFDQESTDGPVERDRINDDGTIRLAPSADMHVELRFTDARGRRWQRDDQGRLNVLAENVARAAAAVSESSAA
ncbi:hypothetical protein [Dactylosporangium matsuzakiense]|uniref:Uncharacterized protein n=1 Tax=Dactylosporangium matsuzakiense TaxID=53360 RepID=A0A9W6NM59_9ACTN|nr:hypothetical protein [Dactylosporangium matsuzakiense]UWZ43223.1 hypothetical protein Dmats_37945 [Dactylosporangium matsuzakiense]GLL02680.1 hypothetical protein GCM10017581_044220 [Dactylosporangium matsuzakiense]